MGRFSAQEIILKKRDGSGLDKAEIDAFVRGIVTEDVTDAQIAALAMAIWFQGMDLNEKTALTLAMRDSGRVLHWDKSESPVLDKHSTGGVGDLVSLILGPLIASCGARVPMISGRGLGHTGGTLDKLESIPGFNTSLSVSRFQSQVRSIGVAIIGQTDDLAPADRRFYAVRDVTATVASIPLIVASILSKKLAEGLDGLVMDVKVGSGAFMRDLAAAQALSQTLSQVSEEAGLSCHCLITDMNLPLAWSAGNALEALEAVEYLRGEKRHQRLDETVRALGAQMVLLGGLAADLPEAQALLDVHLESGSAAETFARMVAAQGGPSDFLDNPGQYLPQAVISQPVFPDADGYITAVDVRSLGLSVVELGGGRQRAEDSIDPSVGLSRMCSGGQKVDTGTPLAMIHAASQADWDRAATRVRSAITISDEKANMPPVVHERIE